MAEQRFIITIGRQFGSGGLDIAQRLAKRLGVKCYDKELLLEAAEEMGANPELFKKHDEKLPTFYAGNFSINLGSFIQSFSTQPTTSYYDDVQRTICDTLHTIAQRESCVIVGRCADYLLRNHPRCINIFISASASACARRIMKRKEADNEEEAIALAKKSNKLRAEYYNFYTDKEWGYSGSYDLCIDSSKMTEDEVVSLILRYIEMRLND